MMKRSIWFTGLFLVLAWASLRAQTIPAPTVNCVTTAPSTGDVTLNWTAPPLDPCGPFVEYVIYGATSLAGPWQVIGTITNQAQTSFVHTGANGTLLDWYYYMEMVQNCPGATSAQSDTIQEVPLDVPQMDVVTVDGDNIQVSWFEANSTQTAGYILYYYDGLTGTPPTPTGTPIDTINDPTDTTFLDTNADPNAQSYSYTVAAFDDCGNTTVFNFDPHNSIFLSAQVDACEQQITLNWNEYINWPGISEYRVTALVDNTPETPESLPSGSTSFIYDIDGINGDSICFTIEAVHQNGNTTSLSNEVCFSLDLVRSTTYNYLQNLTVNNNGGVDLTWYADSAADINTFLIERGDNLTSQPVIDSIPVTAPAPFINTYTDATATTDDTDYYYDIISRDDCAFDLASGLGRTIHLTTELVGQNVELRWNEFEMPNITVLGYTLYRVVNGNLVTVDNFLPTELEYLDPVGTANTEDGTFCYVVEATYQLDIPSLGVSEELSSFSNETCADLPPVIYVPNAFVPNGVNNQFKPVLLFTNIQSYEFWVFDRWGKELFYTENIIAGWNGTNNGENLPMGGYTYMVKVVANSGEETIKRGTFILVR